MTKEVTVQYDISDENGWRFVEITRKQGEVKETKDGEEQSFTKYTWDRVESDVDGEEVLGETFNTLTEAIKGDIEV